MIIYQQIYCDTFKFIQYKSNFTTALASKLRKREQVIIKSVVLIIFCEAIVLKWSFCLYDKYIKVRTVDSKLDKWIVFGGCIIKNEFH